MRRSWILALALPCVLGAQTPSAPVIKSTSSEVVVDFVVHDKHGAIVRDLRPEEVRVFEDDVPQQLRSLTFFESGLSHPATAPPSAAESPAEAAGMRGRQELQNANVVTFFLAGPITVGTDNGVAARDLLRDFLTAEMHSDTYVGVFVLDHGVLYTILPYTNDGDTIGPALTAGVSRLTGRKIEDIAPRKAKIAVFPHPELSPTVKAAVDRVVVRLMLYKPEDESSIVRGSLNLRRLIQAQAELPGRKLLFYVSEGYGVASGRADLLQAVVSAANRSSVTIYGIELTHLTSRSELSGARHGLNDAASYIKLDQETPDSEPVPRTAKAEVVAFENGLQSAYAATTLNLENLATGTGGELIGRTNDLLTPMKRAMEDARSRWEVTYAPSDPREDGRFRKLKVAVSRPGVVVTARSGYYALPILNGEQIEPFEYAPLMALSNQPAARDFEFHAAAIRYQPGPKTQFAVAFETPLRDKTLVPEEDAKKNGVEAHLSFLALVKDADGHVVGRVSKDLFEKAPDQSDVQSAVATWAAPLLLSPGRYTLESAAVDRNSGKASTRRTALSVEPELGLALSDVSLVRGIEPTAEAPNERDPLVIRTGRVIPQVLAEARIGPDLAFYAVVYPAARSVAPLQVVLELLGDGQRVVARREYGPISNPQGGQPMLAWFPSQGLPAGEYEARLTVKQGEVSRQKVLAVTLVK